MRVANKMHLLGVQLQNTTISSRSRGLNQELPLHPPHDEKDLCSKSLCACATRAGDWLVLERGLLYGQWRLGSSCLACGTSFSAVYVLQVFEPGYTHVVGVSSLRVPLLKSLSSSIFGGSISYLDTMLDFGPMLSESSFA